MYDNLIVNLMSLLLLSSIRRRSLEGSVSLNKSKLSYIASEHPHGLMPAPIHFGKYLREKRNLFQLPYDVWWLTDNDMVSVIGTRGIGIIQLWYWNYTIILN